MSRKYKTYYVKSLDKELNIKELETISGISASTLYDRINKLGWDIEKALSQPANSKTYTVKTNSSTITGINYIDEFINKTTTSFCNLEYIVFDKTSTPVIVKFIDVKENHVTPFESHPHRYPSAWYMFTQLVDFSKLLGGYVYVINYNSADDSEYRILKVVNYRSNKISQHIKHKLNYCEYLVIEEDLCLNKNEFNSWLGNLDKVNRSIRNKKYRVLDTGASQSVYSKPSYYKDPIESTDHLGKKFYSFNAMCKEYNMNAGTVKRRLDHGWSTKDALTVPAGEKRV